MKSETFSADRRNDRFLTMLLHIFRDGHALLPVGFRLAVRDFVSDIRQNQLGLAWTFLSPLIYVAAFIFARGISVSPPGGVALSPMSLLAGLILYQLWFDSVASQMAIFSANSIFIKNIGIKTDVFFYAGVIRSVFVSLPKIIIVVGASAYFSGGYQTAVGTVPYLGFALLALINGSVFGYLLAPVAAFMNDIKIAFHSLSLVLMFASLVFMRPEALASSKLATTLIDFNPVAVVVDSGRMALQGSQGVLTSAVPGWIALTVLGLAIALVFNRLAKPLVAERL